MEKDKFHKTKDGKKINISDLETSHLQNIVNLIKRKSKEGLTIRMGGGYEASDMWYDEETYYGREAKKQMNYKAYKDELKNRTDGR